METLEIIFWICLAIVAYTYVGYGILLYIMVKIKELACPPRKRTLPDPMPEVVLMIAAFNEEDIVAQKMENCHALDYPADKLTVCWVTDGSSDSTGERLAAYPEVVTLHRPERRGKTAALNHGMETVTAPITVFTDANTMLNRDAIKNIVLRFTDPNVGCVAGEKRVSAEPSDGSAAAGEGLYWRYESTLKELDSRLYSAVGAAGELFAVRTELFEAMPEDTLLDDFILSMRIAEQGYKIAYASDAYAVEGGSADMHEEQKRKVRIAAGGLQSIARLAPLLNIFRYGMLSFQYISHRVLRWSLTPVTLVALLPINIALVAMHSDRVLYWVLLMLQVGFYAAAFVGKWLSQRGVKKSLLIVPYYFLFMNLNIFLGARYLWKRKRKGVTSGAWEKAKRA